MKYIVDKNTPGFFKRDKKRKAFLRADEGEQKDELMLEWLADYVDGGIEAIMNASENDIDKLLAYIKGEEEESADPKASANSEDG